MDPIIVDLPDGGTAEFPAGTSPDVIKGVLAKRYPPTQGAPARALPYKPPADPITYGGEVSHVADQFTGNINTGMNAVSNAINPVRNLVSPVETVASIVSRLFGGPDIAPISTGMDNMSARVDKVFGPKSEPQTSSGYIAGRAGRMLGETLPLTGAALVAGPAYSAGQPLMSSVAPTAMRSSIVDALMRSIAQNPGTTLAADAASGTIAGGAGAVADLASPGGKANPLVKAGAEMLGGSTPAVYGTVGLAPVAYRTSKDALAAARGQPSTIGNAFRRLAGGAKDAVEQRAGGFVGEQLNAPGVPEEIARAKQVATNVPGFEPTVPQQANAQSLLRTQSRIEGGLQGDELNKATGVYDKNVAAIQDKIRTDMPVAPENAPGVLDSAITKRLDDLETRLAAREADAQARIEATQTAMPTTAPRPGTDDKLYDPKAAGSVLRTERGVIKDKLNRDTAALKAAVDPEGRLNVPADDLREVVKADLEMRGNALTGAPDEPVLLKKLLSPKGDVPETVGFADLQDYRSDVQRRIREMSAAAQPDWTKIEQLKGVVARLDQAVDAGVAKSSDPGIADRAKAFREFYKDEVVPRTQQGVSGQMDRRTPRGDDKVKSEDIPGRFFGPNNLTEAEQFQKLYGHNAPAVQTMTDHALASLRDSAKGQPLTQAHIDKWKAQHARVLDRIPEVRDAVAKVNVADAEKTLAGVRSRREAVADTDLAKRVGDDPAKTVKDAVADPKLMRTLRRTAGEDKDAQDALKRMVWQHVAGDGKELPALDAIKKVLDDPSNRRALEIAGLSRDDLKNLKTIHDAIDIQGRVSRPVGQGANTRDGGPAGAFKDATGSGFNQLVNRFITVARGRSSATYEGGAAAGQFLTNISEKQSDALMKRILWDGRLRSDIAEATQAGKLTPAAFKRLNTYLLTIPGEDREKK